MLPLETYLDAVRHESARLAGAARPNLETPVLACPGWSVADLLRHLGRVHRHKTILLRRRAREDALEWRRHEPEGDLVEWFQRGADDLGAALAEVDPDAEVWNWSASANVARFWHRRMAHETAIHRWDVEQAVGAPDELDPDLAGDGIAEFLEVWMPTASLRGAGERIHLHRSDGEGEWLLTIGAEGILLRSGHAKGDAALRGKGSDLLLVLWGRRDVGDVECFGDRALVERFLASLDTT